MYYPSISAFAMRILSGVSHPPIGIVLAYHVMQDLRSIQAKGNLKGREKL
jgi:hypothetical protein